MKLPTLTQLQLHADVSHEQTYAYEFTVKGKKNRWFRNNGPPGCTRELAMEMKLNTYSEDLGLSVCSLIV